MADKNNKVSFLKLFINFQEWEQLNHKDKMLYRRMRPPHDLVFEKYR